MSAGTGVVHSEYNLEDEDTKSLSNLDVSNKKCKTKMGCKKFPKRPVEATKTFSYWF